MRHTILPAALCMIILVDSSCGAPIQLLEGVPNSYVPGQSVAFGVRLPAISDLGSYNIDIVLKGSVGTAGVDYHFDVAATVPAATNYVFPSPVNYFDAANVDSTTQHRISLTDFDFGGVNVVPDSNDRVATVVFRTASSFSGNLALFVDTAGLLLDTSDVVPTPIVGFDALKADIATSGSIELDPVPEPSSLCLLLLAMAGAAACNRQW